MFGVMLVDVWKVPIGLGLGLVGLTERRLVGHVSIESLALSSVS